MPNYAGGRRVLTSWLEQAIDEFPQAKATGQQILAALKKNPQVSMEEVKDRGFDKYLSSQEGVLATDEVAKWLKYNPVNMGEDISGFEIPDKMDFNPDDYRTRSVPLAAYNETVTTFPDVEPRSGISDHYPTPGYAWHTRSGQSSDENLGRVIDELQRDSGRQVTKEFNPLAEFTPPTSDEMGSANYLSGQVHRNFDGVGMEDLHRMIYSPGQTGRYYERPFNHNLGDANDMVDIYRQELDPSMEFQRGVLDDIDAHNRNVQSTAPGPDDPYNTPGRTRWPWHAMSKELVGASNAGEEYLSWPAAEQQYRRYYQRSPEALRSQLEAGWAGRAGAMRAQGIPEETISQRQATHLDPAAKAARDQQFYQNFYDKDLPQDRRWAQMGVTPEQYTDPARGEKFWRVPLKNLPQEIPYYGIGGAAALGSLEEEDYRLSPGGFF